MELPKRKDNRLKDFDYSSNGAYFVTICVKDRRNLLGKVDVGDAALGVPFVKLNRVGEMVKQHIENITQNDVMLDNYVIMPNHLHLLVRVDGETPKAASPTKAVIPQMVNALKGLTSKKYGESLWQRSYHDHIIRNNDDYLRLWQYIDENPAKWVEYKYYCE